MKKYWVAYKNALSAFLQYRANLGLLVISHLFSTSGLVFLWVAVYRNGDQVGSYTLGALILYYVAITVLRLTISDAVGMAFRVDGEINEGQVANYLVKPFNYALFQLMRLSGEATINILFVMPFVFLLAYLGRHLVPIPPPTLWVLAAFSAALSFLLYFLLYFLAALSSFWVHRGSNVVYGVLLVSNFLNGGLLPLDLFPAWYAPINTALPFRLLLFTPVQIFLGKEDAWLHTFFSYILWIGVFSLAIVLVWKRAIKKFEAVGQ